ncbi:MAG: hypothetical protein AMXMBFR81_07970 [Chthonomonas sp.]
MSVEARRKEFFANVWDHSKDPFQTQFDIVPPFSDPIKSAVRTLHGLIRDQPDDTKIAATLKELISANGPELTACLLQLAGLTRNKVISDLHASSFAGHKPSSYKGLHTSESWSASGPYLVASLRKVLEPVEVLSDGVIEALNKATRPGFIRQERAKRQGHEAEARLAGVLLELQVPFEPEGKVENPLCPDAQIGGVSFDLVIPDTKRPLIVVKSTVHTSNIGQYGESKDHLEITEARDMLEKSYTADERPTLMALIDGIGFRSNAAGLNGVLEKADEFCQFGTLWKAVVVAAYRLGKVCLIDADEAYMEDFSGFLSRYGKAIKATKLPGGVPCGKVRMEISG